MILVAIGYKGLFWDMWDMWSLVFTPNQNPFSYFAWDAVFLQLIKSIPWHPTLAWIQVPFLFMEKFKLLGNILFLPAILLPHMS